MDARVIAWLVRAVALLLRSQAFLMIGADAAHARRRELASEMIGHASPTAIPYQVHAIAPIGDGEYVVES